MEEKRRLLAVLSEEGKAAHAQHVLRVQNALAQALVAICVCGIGADGNVETGMFECMKKSENLKNIRNIKDMKKSFEKI